MNALLKLEFFKSLGFPTKEAGVQFIKANPKLKKQIEEKVDEVDEAKYLVLESIKETIFPKYNDKKEIFLIKVKNERSQKLADKKELQKKALKEEMRAELLKELKDEEKDEVYNKLKKNYPKAIPSIDTDDIETVAQLEDLFLKVIKRVDNGEIDEDELVIIEKTKDQVEKAMAVLVKASKTLQKY